MRARQDAVGDRLDQLLHAWQCDVCSEPVPMLVDSAHAIEVIRIAERADRVRASPDDDARTRSRDR